MNHDLILEAVEELKRRSEHPIRQYKPGAIPGWNQLAFHESMARYRLVFGGNRSGKSFCNAFELACWLSGDHPYRQVPPPPVKIWVISVEYQVILDGIYNHLQHLIPDWQIAKVGSNIPNTILPSYILLKNGSKVTFKSAKGLGDDTRRKFQAADIDLISIDEEIDETILTELRMRTLDRGGTFIISATLVESYDWIVQMEELADANDPDYSVVRLHTELNPYLHKETVAHIKTLMSPEEVDVRYYGKSRRSTGLIYNTFKPSIHCIPRFSIPFHWPRWNSLDPGIRVFGGLWLTCDPDGYLYLYREMYLTNTPLWEVALTVKTAENWKLDRTLSDSFGHCVWEEEENAEHMVTRLIDDKRGSRLITGDEGVLDQLYSRYGILTTPADKVRRPGIEDVRHALEPLAESKAPRLRIFDDLEKTIWEMKRYRIRDSHTKKNQNEPIDEPVKKDDHLMDCLRYLMRENPRWEDRQQAANYDGVPDNMYSLESYFKQLARKRQPVDEFLGAEV